MNVREFQRRLILILIPAGVFLLATAAPGPASAAPRFNVLRVAPKGSVPPRDFAYPDLAGKIHRLSAYKGKVVLLAFFATWCPMCNEEMPKLIGVHKKWKGRGFTVLAVSIDRAGAGLVRRWTKQKKLNYPILHDQGYASRRTHNVHFVPTLYLLGRGHEPAAWAVGRADWAGERATAIIERLLAEKKAARSSKRAKIATGR